MIIIGKYHNIRLFSGRLILMIFVGIDIAELNHFTSAISYNKGVIIEPFSFTNYSDGLYMLLSKLSHFEKDSIISGLESMDTLRQHVFKIPC
ncbi:hypothetical protein HMPREF9443_01269 [Phascolarctobacterium succinatutens YIT 12067]|uniref:Uncharacterized protein n=2 Tax=Phascolarctobacterium succinatutens TaxID=626940 RepID=E8LEI5_9FIRM|nr:hypothetical protein HMPREF9443_01269 [Phascolarctobacterium succinatutens YIT 12067]